MQGLVGCACPRGVFKRMNDSTCRFPARPILSRAVFRDGGRTFSK